MWIFYVLLCQGRKERRVRDIGREGEREGVHDGEDRIREDRKGC